MAVAVAKDWQEWIWWEERETAGLELEERKTGVVVQVSKWRLLAVLVSRSRTLEYVAMLREGAGCCILMREEMYYAIDYIARTAGLEHHCWKLSKMSKQNAVQRKNVECIVV